MIGDGLMDDSTIKREPNAAQRAGASEITGLYVALRDEGMTQQQALYLIGVMLGQSSGMGGGPE